MAPTARPSTTSGAIRDGGVARHAATRRFDRRARGLFIAFVAVWLLCFGLSIHASVTGVPMPGVYVHAHDAGDYPRVEALALAEAAGQTLQPGDLLLRWDEHSLQGFSVFDLHNQVAAHTAASDLAPVTVRRDGQVLRLRTATGSHRAFWPRLPASLIFLLTAAVFVFRSAPAPLTRAIVLTLCSWALLFACTFAGPIRGYLANAAQVLGVSGVCVFGLRTTMLFPHGVLPRSRLLRALPYAFAVIGPLDFERVEGAVIPREIAHSLGYALSLALLLLNVGFAVRNYLRAGPLERRQIKWVFFAFWLAALLSIVAIVGALLQPALSVQYYVTLSSMALFAIALLVAVTRFNLFDIDRILSATASLSLLLGGGLVVLLLGAPHLTALVGEVLGLQANLAQPLVVLVVSGVAVAGARAAYPLVDRLLFVERAALQRNLSALLRQVKAADSPQAATELVGRELARLLRPQVLAIYDHDDPAWPLYFAHGHAVVPALPQQTRLPDALARAGDVLSFEAGGSRRPESLTPLDRSLVQALDARVVLGIRDVDGLRELLFIGPKGSGDLFVHSDLALLASIAHALSATHERLQRKASEKVSESEPSPTEHALRSYVPGPLVSHIVRGEPIEQGEKDVTLLFIDIRGYSSYAEHRAPSEVFSMVSTYTRGVSEIVLRHHGTVVEFNGDGMMVVFGAPASVDHKEEHAVHAARELITRARQIVPLDRDDGLTPIGIGIATGRAFVGSVQGSDRAIWTALGASTNRAARLQGVTRELHADIVIDEATYRALGTVRRQFELHRGMQLRGHAERNNLYSMALEPLPAAPAIHAATA